MAIGWSTAAVLVLLLPGFLFFAGFLSADRVSRDTTPRSALGQLAGTVLISLLVHSILLLVLSAMLPRIGLAGPNLRIALGALLAGASGAPAIDEIAANIQQNLFQVSSYLLLASGLGFFSGRYVGEMVTGKTTGLRRALSRRLGFLVEHRWVYEVVSDSPGNFNATYAHLLTKTGHEGNWLLYRGPIHRFGLTPEGRFAYFVLRRADCRVLELRDGVAVLRPPAPVDSSRRLRDREVQMPQRLDYLYLDGTEVANAYFNRYALAPTTEGKIRRQIEKTERGKPG